MTAVLRDSSSAGEPATPAVDVSVVVATHNRADRLRATLAGLRAQTVGADRFEVLIIDDGSRDETPAVLAEALQAGGLRLRTFRYETGGGPARARNRGWREARAELVAFTDDDCVPTPGWLEAMLAVAGDRRDAVVQGPTVPNPDELPQLNRYSKTMHLPGPTPHLETCNVLYPRTLLEAADGFDEAYPAPAGEDSDLAARVLGAGAEALFAPAAVVHHAVFKRSLWRALDDARMATHGVQAYKLNPNLRAHLPLRVFYDRSHPLLLLAGLGLALTPVQPVAAVAVAPYLLHLHRRTRGDAQRAGAMAYAVLYDAVQVGATVRGAFRHRFPLV